jgi:hypothetical protein
MRLGWWLATEQTAEANSVKIILYGFLLLGFLGALWISVIRWIDNRQLASSPPNAQGTITQEQPQAPILIATIPKSLLSWTPPTGKFHTGLRECIRRGRDLLELYQSAERMSDRPHRLWIIGVGTYIASRAKDADKGSFTVRWGQHNSPNDSPTLPLEVHGRNRKLSVDILSRIQLLEEFVRELES